MSAQLSLETQLGPLSRPRFAEWVRTHPEIVERFIAHALRCKRHGRRIGAKAIAEELRYAPELQRRAGDEWKIDNTMTAPLAALAEARVPELAGYFRRRKRIA